MCFPHWKGLELPEEEKSRAELVGPMCFPHWKGFEPRCALTARTTVTGPMCFPHWKGFERGPQSAGKIGQLWSNVLSPLEGI